MSTDLLKQDGYEQSNFTKTVRKLQRVNASKVSGRLSCRNKGRKRRIRHEHF